MNELAGMSARQRASAHGGRICCGASLCTVTANPLAGGATCPSTGTEPLNAGDFVVLIVGLKNPTIANDFTNAAFYTNVTCE